MKGLAEDIAGKTALVTGASSGIGRAIGIRFAKAGLKVVALGRSLEGLRETEAAIQDIGGQCHLIQTDISESGAMDIAMDQAVAAFGQVDILVNNAGVMYMDDPVHADRVRWEKMLNINLLAVIEGCTAAIRHMRASNIDGKIINISSLASRLMGSGVYGASKIAVEKYTQELRETLENDSIRVTTIIPGGFSTNLGRDMSQASRDAFQRKMGQKVVEAQPDEDGRTPYFGLADDVARTVLFAAAQPTYLNISELVVRPARNIDPSAFSES
ncbi:MAG: SDR family oxidoreductase [Pseudomonadota bacterium]